jgi:putative peptidoglycan lipid II flippase
MGLLRSTAVFSSMTFISRITGLVRDVVFAAYFEFGKATDAFLIAFKIPNFLRRLFAEGAFSQAFVPVLSEYKVRREAEDVQELVAATAGTLGVILLLLTTLVVLITPLFVMLIALGYIGDPAQVDLTAQMLRITFPYIFFISLTALAGGVLNTYGRFALPAFTPVLLNLSLIGAAIWLSDYFTVPAMALAWGVLIAGIVQLLLQLPFLLRLKLLRWPRWGWRDPGVRRIMKLMLPGLIGSSAMQINLLFDVMVASFLAFGSITWLYFADRMMEFPLGMFGIALATVILPHLSEKFARQDGLAFSRTLDWALRWVLIIGLPAAVGLGVLAGPILATLFLHGDKTVHDLQMMALALVAYSFGLLGFMLVKVLVPGYFARQDTKTPMKVAMIAMLANMLFNIILVVALVKLNYTAPHAGLAFATTLSSFINALLLLRGLLRDKVFQPEAGWGGFVLRVGLAAALMGTALWWLAGDWQVWSGFSSWQRIGHLAWLIPAGAAMYFVLLWLGGIRLAQFRRPVSD